MAGPRSLLVATMQTKPVTWFMSRYIDRIDGWLRRVSGGRISIARLLANPDARAEVPRRSVDVRAEQLSSEEMALLWPHFDAVYPGYAGYRETVGDRRAIRMFRLVPR